MRNYKVEEQTDMQVLVEPASNAPAGATELLFERFCNVARSAEHNRSLIKKLFSSGSFHCHRRGAEVSMGGFRVAFGISEERCVVAVGCFRHVPPPRRSPGAGFSELLLLAVRREQERRGFGREIVAAILRESVQVGSSRLMVVSSGHGFWDQPSFGLKEIGSPDACGSPIFVPWSVGIRIVGRIVSREGAEALDAVCLAAERRRGAPTAAPMQAAPCSEEEGTQKMGEAVEGAGTAAGGELASADAPHTDVGDGGRPVQSPPTRKQVAAYTAASTPKRPRSILVGVADTTFERHPLRKRLALEMAATDGAEAPVDAGVGAPPARPARVAASGRSTLSLPSRIQAIQRPSAEPAGAMPSAPAPATPKSVADESKKVALFSEPATSRPANARKRRSAERAGSGLPCRAFVSCRACDAPGAQRREAANGGALCRACHGRWISKEYCPVCECFWSDTGEDANMLQCDACEVWVHARCERILGSLARWDTMAYSCPGCRGAAPGQGLPSPAVAAHPSFTALVSQPFAAVAAHPFVSVAANPFIAVAAIAVQSALCQAGNCSMSVGNSLPGFQLAAHTIVAATCSESAATPANAPLPPPSAHFDPAVAARYTLHAAQFDPLVADNLEEKLGSLCDGLESVYGALPTVSVSTAV